MNTIENENSAVTEVSVGGIKPSATIPSRKKPNAPKKTSGSGTTSLVGFSVLGLIFLLGYSYVELIGWMYFTMGDAKKSLYLMAIFALVLIITSFLLPRIWSSNTAFVSKRRKKLMCITSFIFAVAMLLSFIGVNNFARVYHEREEITNLYNKGINEARLLYPDYDEYVNKRVIDYENTLKHAVARKNTNPHEYMEYVGRFPGTNDSRRISNLTKSLSRTLKPTNDRLQQNFNEWLDGVDEANVWNLSFASNVTALDHKVSSCVKALSEVSARYFHPGEDNTPYEYKAYVSNTKLLTLLSSNEFYISWRSLLIFILTAFTLIMPTLRDGLRSRKDL